MLKIELLQIKLSRQEAENYRLTQKLNRQDTGFAKLEEQLDSVKRDYETSSKVFSTVITKQQIKNQ